MKTMRIFLFRLTVMFITVSSVFAQNTISGQGTGGQNLNEMEPFWRQALGGTVLSIPSVQAQSAVVALDGGNIRAYSASGTSLWNYYAGGRISPYVTRSREGSTYFSRTSGVFIALNRAGRELWRRNLDGPLCAHAVTGWDGRLFVPTNGKIYCYTSSGTLLWTRILDSAFTIAPKLDRNGGIIFALGSRNVYSLDPFGNSKVWPLAGTPAAIVSLDQREIVVFYADGTIEQLGYAEEWYMSALGDSHSSALPALPARPLAAAAMGNNIAVTMSDGRTALVSIDDRTVAWTGDSHIRESTRAGTEQEVQMLFDERGIFVFNLNGATCFSHDGRRLWYTLLANSAAMPAFGNDGILYSGGRDWVFYAYKIEDRALQEKVSLYGPLPEGTYGMGRPGIFNTFGIPLTDSETKAKIDQIAAGISAGAVGINEPEWTSFLLTTSAGRNPLQLRLAAIDLLGKIGSQETIQWLVNIFMNDSEPFIKAAAANAIGDIGVDPQGIAIQAFLFFVVRSSTRDDFVLSAVASATGALCRFSGPPLSDSGIRILTLLSANTQPFMTRRQAVLEIESLR
ncbi:MAG: PQQ-binding-like beta-propeller repeat protein [Treponema sp.]|nr:PQQ-binding-like beta-propeller repeat protein [Treponema sp.]